MKVLEEHLNECYLEIDEYCIFVYKIIKDNGKYGLICHEIQVKPFHVYIYNDFPLKSEYDFISTFIPSLDSNCKAKLIPEHQYIDLISGICKIKESYDAVKSMAINFVKKYGLEQKI